MKIAKKTAAQRHNARILGDGESTLVLSHGFGTDQTAWRHMLPSLVRSHRVVLYDLACAGSVGTDVFDIRRHADLDGYAEDLLSVLDDLGVDRCSLLSHSVSGMIGMLAARQSPNRFERLLMIAPSPRYLNDGDYFGGFERTDLQHIYDAIRENFREWAREFAPFAVRQDAAAEASRDFAESLSAMRPDIALWAVKAVFESDVRGKLGECRVPAIILQTRDDPAVPMAVAEYLVRHIPDAVLQVIEARGHLPHLSAPEQVLAALRPHLVCEPSK